MVNLKTMKMIVIYLTNIYVTQIGFINVIVCWDDLSKMNNANAWQKLPLSSRCERVNLNLQMQRKCSINES